MLLLRGIGAVCENSGQVSSTTRLKLRSRRYRMIFGIQGTGQRTGNCWLVGLALGLCGQVHLLITRSLIASWGGAYKDCAHYTISYMIRPSNNIQLPGVSTFFTRGKTPHPRRSQTNKAGVRGSLDIRKSSVRWSRRFRHGT
jgi:hypothetical protein